MSGPSSASSSSSATHMMLISSSSITTTRRGGGRRIIGDVWQAQQQRLLQQQTKNRSLFASLAASCRCCTTSRSSPAALPSLLYCSAVTESDSSDSESETMSTTSSSETMAAAASVLASTTTTTTTWKETLLRYSNYASALCVLDCTVLPIVTLLLPLLGIVAITPASLHWLHHAGHQLALYFVLPVGFTATTTNYWFNHKSIPIIALGWVGLALVGISNVHWHWHGSNVLYQVLHLVQHGPGHRVANLLGCACLLGSNYWSRQRGCTNVDCGHDHSHDHLKK